MKRILLPIGGLLIASSAMAQTFSEDFQSNTMPAAWVINDVDGNTPATNVNWCTDGWVVRDDFADATNKVAASVSWYTPAGQSDDWMIIPNISISDPNTVLAWRSMAQDPSYPDGYEVRIAPGGGSTATTGSFSDVAFSTGADGNAWANHQVSLGSYDGTTISIAFRNNSNDQFVLMVDDIEVKVVSALDMEGVAITSPAAAVGLNQAPFTIEADFMNAGATTITSVDISYSIDGGTPVTETGVSVNVAPGGTLSHSFSTPWTPAAAGNYDVEAWCSNLNGSADGNTANDIASLTVGVAANAATKLPLYEHFTSNTCGPCASFNPGFQTLLDNNNVNASNAGVANVKYQMDWPAPNTEESWNQDADDRRGYYGVTGIPSPWFEGAGAAANQAEIDGVGPAFVEITGGAAYNTGTTTVDVDIDINPLTNLGTKTLYMAVVENDYTNTGGTNGETQFHEVMRKMLPGSGGQSVNLTAGSVNVTESYTFTVGSVTQGSYNLWVGMNNLTVVAWVQDDSNQEVLQAAVFPVAEGAVGIEEEEKNFSLSIYPNPTTEDAFIVVDMKEANELSMQIMDITGSLVKAENLGVRNGEQVLNFNGAELDAGIYFVKIQVGNQVITKRVTLTK